MYLMAPLRPSKRALTEKFNEILNEKVTTALTPEQFLSKVMVLRSESDHLRAATTAISANVLEQWQQLILIERALTVKVDLLKDLPQRRHAPHAHLPGPSPPPRPGAAAPHGGATAARR